jgi:hypothetical protein
MNHSLHKWCAAPQVNTFDVDKGHGERLEHVSQLTDGIALMHVLHEM